MMTEQEFLRKLESLAEALEWVSKSRALGQWEAGYNVSCGSRAKELKKLLKQYYKGEKYQVSYNGQILTGLLSFEEAFYFAAVINADIQQDLKLGKRHDLFNDVVEVVLGKI